MAASGERSTRAHDIVVWGATGFTGRLVAEYLTGARTPTTRIALAGRRREELEAVRRELAAIDADAAGFPILIGDSFDRASLDAITRDAHVVVSTVGPFAKYGEALVASCAAHGTDYCDITGETHFIRAMIDQHHEQARSTGARIVHCCGFDSIPSDLGTLMLQQAAREKWGKPLQRVRFFAGESSGSVSGGTVASMLSLLDEAKGNKKVRRILGDPYALNPEGERDGPDGSDPMGVHYESDLKMWVGPFMMAAINTRIVRRSNALLGYPYGRRFRYSEQMSFGKGPTGALRASGFAAGMAAFVAGAAIGPVRALLEKTVLPSPGEGPDREKRERGFFVVRLIGDGPEDRQLTARVEGHSDPGYGETAKMLGESALCLAHDALEVEGGVRTPASTMGMSLVERLRAAGMVFRVG